MKKIISILLLIILICSLSACKKQNNTSSELDTSISTEVSSKGTSAENTTNEENSGSTPSTNTTPSTNPSSKTEESKPTNNKPKVIAGEYTVTFNYGYNNIKTTAKSKNYKVANPGNPTRKGYNFCGWYAENEDTPWSFAGHMVTENMTLTARWQEIMVSSSAVSSSNEPSSVSSDPSYSSSVSSDPSYSSSVPAN